MSDSFWRTSFHREWGDVLRIRFRWTRQRATGRLWSLVPIARAPRGQTSEDRVDRKKAHTAAPCQTLSRCLFSVNRKHYSIEGDGEEWLIARGCQARKQQADHVWQCQGGEFFKANEVTDVRCFASLSCYSLKGRVVKTWRQRHCESTVVILPILVWQCGQVTQGLAMPTLTIGTLRSK